MIDEKSLAGIIDHTFLKTELEGVNQKKQKESIITLVDEAITYNAYSVCLRPHLVSLAKKRIREQNASLKICSVIGFPFGDDYPTSKIIDELEKAKSDGADEFDMVLKYKTLKNGHDAIVYNDILSISNAAKKNTLKIIFENYFLTSDEKNIAYELVDSALQHSTYQANRFYKTSTGFAKANDDRPIGATLEDLVLMKKFTYGKYGLKAAGGISNQTEALKFFKASGSPLTDTGLPDPMKFRIGSSGLLKSLFHNGHHQGY